MKSNRLVLLIALNLLIGIPAYTFTNKLFSKKQLNVIVFFSPTCPICKYYTGEINKIIDSLNVNVVVIVPKYSILNKDEITQFNTVYKPKFTLIYDKSNKITQHFIPTTTPEFYITQNDSILYQGAFDDKYISIGNKNNVIRHPYFYNAINGILNNTDYVHKTDAIGCFVTLKKK